MVPTTSTTAAVDTEALLADLGAITPSKGGHACHAGAELSRLPEEVREAVELLLDAPGVSTTSICDVLARHGLRVRTGNLARHRRRQRPNGCLCPRTSGASE